ncbi:serine hydrolase domain-containing protein [Mucilaginibacter lappiensis]|uniref:CubicO group peptidase (Beta-lactamase class C family) n=1 Tax=Mucilaginibacter lappiensis TaxID=354630 RepID=A0A841JF12_9SPHI|nr:serine hydrolase domain-containing protein [Mucilaginibacter lappiensis]MBB6129154.1 CubicO group peptidase (beta-lactamase class C family) [Mucilaginibacter lappiensis]
MKKFLFLILTTVVYSYANAQDLSKRLDSLFNGQFTAGQINGNVLVADHGKVIYKKSFGYADIANKILNTDHSAFFLASVSKTITSTAVLQLVQKKKIQLNEPYKKYFPNFPYADVTIKNLLSHTSGLPRDMEDVFDTVLKVQPQKKFGYHDIIPALQQYHKPLAFKPGDQYSYSNINYNLLALLVEKTSKMPFDAYLKKYIFTPAGMTNTYLSSPQLLQKSDVTLRYLYPKHYYPHLKLADSIPEIANIYKNYTIFWGQGNVISTTTDLLKFDQALYNNKLVSAKILDEAFKPTILNNKQEAVAGGGVSYGLGWFILKVKPSENIVLHTGAIQGLRSVFIRNLTKQQTVIILDNAQSGTNFITASNAISILDNTPQEKVKISVADKYAKILFESGSDVAASRLIQMQADTVHYRYSAHEMDFIANELLNDSYTDKALEALKVNLLLNPTNPDMYNSYGKALNKAGKKTEAILIYKRALKLKPDNKEAQKALSKLEKDSSHN